MKPDLMVMVGDDGQAAGAAGGGNRNGCMTVPVAALTVPDEQDAPSAPTAGDRVSYQVDGIVERVDGDQAEVRATAINGTPLPQTPSEPREAAEDADYANLRKLAAEQGDL